MLSRTFSSHSPAPFPPPPPSSFSFFFRGVACYKDFARRTCRLLYDTCDCSRKYLSIYRTALLWVYRVYIIQRVSNLNVGILGVYREPRESVALEICFLQEIARKEIFHLICDSQKSICHERISIYTYICKLNLPCKRFPTMRFSILISSFSSPL